MVLGLELNENVEMYQLGCDIWGTSIDLASSAPYHLVQKNNNTMHLIFNRSMMRVVYECINLIDIS